jgi:hypothetical protein
LFASTVGFGTSDDNRGEFIQTFTDTLEHNEAQRNSNHRVDLEIGIFSSFLKKSELISAVWLAGGLAGWSAGWLAGWVH